MHAAVFAFIGRRKIRKRMAAAPKACYNDAGAIGVIAAPQALTKEEFPMEKTVIATPNAPSAIGPYSQGIKANGFVFVSGCLPVDMQTGELSTGDIAEQTRCAMQNLSAILEAAGSNLQKVVKTTVFLKDLGNFQTVNGAYAAFFPAEPPARACIQVAALPKDAELEIEAIAVE